MSSNNNNSGEAMGFALVIAILGLAALFVYALALFAAFVFTGIALCAWNKPRRIFGSVLTPEEARMFVWRGIMGAALLPIFAVFCGLLFEFRIEDAAWPHLFLAGYALGSLGVAMLEPDAPPSQQDGFSGMTIEAEPARPAQPAPPKAPAAGFAPQPAFRFASWDDEEELKR